MLESFVGPSASSLERSSDRRIGGRAGPGATAEHRLLRVQLRQGRSPVRRQPLETGRSRRQHGQLQPSLDHHFRMRHAVGHDRRDCAVSPLRAVPAKPAVGPAEKIGERLALGHAEEPAQLVPPVEPHVVEPIAHVVVGEQRNRAADVVRVDVREHEQLDPRDRQHALPSDRRDRDRPAVDHHVVQVGRLAVRQPQTIPVARREELDVERARSDDRVRFGAGARCRGCRRDRL